VVTNGCTQYIDYTFNVTDDCGNPAIATVTRVTRTFDETLPVITCPADSPFTVVVNSGNVYIHGDNTWDATATDNCPGTVTLTAMLTGDTESGPHTTLNGVTFNQGLTTVTWTATDECGNTATCTFDVQVDGTADLEVIKILTSLIVDDSISAGDPVTYTVTVTNNGPVASGAIVLTDLPPSEILNPEYSLDGITWLPWTGTIDITNLNDDESIDIYFRGTADCPGDKVITNTASIDFADGNPITDPDYDNNTSTEETGHRDHTPPTFTAPGPLNFCVLDIFSALYDGQPEPAADIIPAGWVPGEYRRPDWYIVAAGSDELDLLDLDDNCCELNELNISWIISFSTGHPAITGTGQPSTYDPDNNGTPDPIRIWGTPANINVTHTITYTVTDCNGNPNPAVPVIRNILIRPRPEVIKLY
jgi:uncharacterized repeat protein (TIGR01451 family)